MNVTGEYELNVEREAVWKALLDPEVLRKCIPGCREFEQTTTDSFRAIVDVKVGPVSASFATTFRLTNVVPPETYRLEGDAKAGPVGFGKGHADVALLDAPGTVTVLRYTAEFQVGGRLAQLGSRMLVPATQKVADEFFGRLAAEIDPTAVHEPGALPPSATAQAEEFAPEHASTGDGRRRGKPPLMFRLVLILVLSSALLLLVWGLWARFISHRLW